MCVLFLVCLFVFVVVFVLFTLHYYTNKSRLKTIKFADFANTLFFYIFAFPIAVCFAFAFSLTDSVSVSFAFSSKIIMKSI